MKISISVERLNRKFLVLIIVGVIFIGESYYYSNIFVSEINREIAHNSGIMTYVEYLVGKFDFTSQTSISLNSTNEILKSLEEINGSNSSSIESRIELNTKMDKLFWKLLLAKACTQLPNCVGNITAEEIDSTVENREENITKFNLLVQRYGDMTQDYLNYLATRNQFLQQGTTKSQEFATLLNIIGVFFISLASYYGCSDKFSSKGFLKCIVAVIILFFIVLFVGTYLFNV
jgi:hypothetical protein